MPVDYAGNTLGTARSISITPSPQTLNDWVGSKDTNDYYRFSLSSHSSFYLGLNNLTANADVQLLSSNGTVIASSTNSDTTAESISTNLDAGTYYIRVFPYSNANTYYNLTVATPADYAGNAPSNARSIPVSSSTNTYTDFIGTADLSDYYGFTLSNTSNLQLSLNGLSADADVQLLRLNTNGTTTQVAGSASSGTMAEAININNLAAGNYLAYVYQYSGDTFYNLSISATASTPPGTPSGSSPTDWFSQNLYNATIVSLTRSLDADGQLSRDDMIAILRAAEHSGTVDGVIDATEITDFRTIVNNANLLGMPDYVRVLSNKIINGDPANQTYQGMPLGNLYAGSSAVQMEKLIGKWFLGSDHPVAKSSDGTTTYSYQYASGSLFQNGISYSDIKQGDVADCYFLAGLAETAFRSPSTINSMFIDNGDNTYTVRFYKDGVADYVTVDKYLPTNASGYLVYANVGNLYSSPSNELWVALAEKAYAQINQSGWIGQDNTNSYQGIAYGWDSYALNQITKLSVDYENLDFNDMVSAFTSGSYMLVDSKDSGVASNVVPNHSYVVIGYSPSTQKFTLFNPWGVNGGYYDSDGDGIAETFKPGTLQLSFSQLTASFDAWAYT